MSIATDQKDIGYLKESIDDLLRWVVRAQFEGHDVSDIETQAFVLEATVQDLESGDAARVVANLLSYWQRHALSDPDPDSIGSLKISLVSLLQGLLRYSDAYDQAILKTLRHRLAFPLTPRDVGFASIFRWPDVFENDLEIMPQYASALGAFRTSLANPQLSVIDALRLTRHEWWIDTLDIADPQHSDPPNPLGQLIKTRLVYGLHVAIRKGSAVAHYWQHVIANWLRNLRKLSPTALLSIWATVVLFSAPFVAVWSSSAKGVVLLSPTLLLSLVAATVGLRLSLYLVRRS